MLPLLRRRAIGACRQTNSVIVGRRLARMASPASSSRPIPIVLCGAKESMGKVVIEALKPEYEVVHFVKGVESGPSIIPALLAGQTPPAHPDSSSIGTGNYSQIPRAVLLGGAFGEEATAPLRAAVDDVPGTRKVPWVRQDTTKAAAAIGTPEYGKAVVARSKETLARLEREGKMNGEYNYVEFY